MTRPSLRCRQGAGSRGAGRRSPPYEGHSAVGDPAPGAGKAGSARRSRATAAAGTRRRVSNNQDDIDAMLASLDEATPEADIRPAAARRRGVRTHRRDGVAGSAASPGPRRGSFHKVDPQDDIEFTEAGADSAAAAGL